MERRRVPIGALQEENLKSGKRDEELHTASEFKESNLYDGVAEKSPDGNGHLILSPLGSMLQQK